MSLTSYRAAPPRAGGRAPCGADRPGIGREERMGLDDLGGPGGDRLSRVLRHSTMGAETFDGRVRDGIGSCRLAKATRPAKIVRRAARAWEQARRRRLGVCRETTRAVARRGSGCEALVLAPAPSLGDGHGLMRAIKPDERLVPVSCTHCCASTPGLSTWWSSTALQGELVSRWVSSLDAFSSYPVRT